MRRTAPRGRWAPGRAKAVAPPIGHRVKALHAKIAARRRPKEFQPCPNAKVNILSCLTTTSGNEGQAHAIVDNVNKAKKALEAAGLSYTEADVLQVELPNTPGALGKFAGKLAEKDINITLGYATGVKGSKKAGLVLAVSDLDKAARIR